MENGRRIFVPVSATKGSAGTPADTAARSGGSGGAAGRERAALLPNGI